MQRSTAACREASPCTSADDLLTLLIAAGPDTVGDVSVVAVGEAPTPSSPAVDLRRLEDPSFREL